MGDKRMKTRKCVSCKAEMLEPSYADDEEVCDVCAAELVKADPQIAVPQEAAQQDWPYTPTYDEAAIGIETVTTILMELVSSMQVCNALPAKTKTYWKVTYAGGRRSLRIALYINDLCIRRALFMFTRDGYSSPVIESMLDKIRDTPGFDTPPTIKPF